MIEEYYFLAYCTGVIPSKSYTDYDNKQQYEKRLKAFKKRYKNAVFTVCLVDSKTTHYINNI